MFPTEKAFNNLTKKQKEVWQLVMRELFSEYDAADLLGITRDSVHNRLMKARRRYRKFLED